MTTRDDLNEIIRLHRLWAQGHPEGKRVDLRGVDLRDSDLRGVDLRDSDLRGVDLRDSDLRGVDLRDSDLRGANLWPNWEVKSYRDLLWIGPLGSRNDWLLVNVPTLRVQTGCFEGPLEDFVAAVEKTHGENEYGREYRATAAYLMALAAVHPKPAPSAAEAASMSRRTCNRYRLPGVRMAGTSYGPRRPDVGEIVGSIACSLALFALGGLLIAVIVGVVP